MNKWLRANGLKILGIGITIAVITVGIIVQFSRHGYDIEQLIEKHDAIKALMVSIDEDVEELQLMIERLAVSVGSHSEGLYRIECILMGD